MCCWCGMGCGGQTDRQTDRCADRRAKRHTDSNGGCVSGQSEAVAACGCGGVVGWLDLVGQFRDVAFGDRLGQHDRWLHTPLVWTPTDTYCGWRAEWGGGREEADVKFRGRLLTVLLAACGASPVATRVCALFQRLCDCMSFFPGSCEAVIVVGQHGTRRDTAHLTKPAVLSMVACKPAQPNRVF